MYKSIILSVFLAFLSISTFSQTSDSLKIVDYSNPKEYIIDSVIVSGVEFLDKAVLASMSGLEKGMKIAIPSDEITKLIKKYWNHGLFEDVNVSVTYLPNEHIYLNIKLKERPRISKFDIEGISKSEKDDLKAKINIRPGNQLTQNVINEAITIIKKYYTEKGFFNAEVAVKNNSDTIKNNKRSLIIKVSKNKRVKIKKIILTGNKDVSANKLIGAMKKTKRRDWKFWNTSKFIESDFKEDKELILDYFNEKGYRDAKIISDSISFLNTKRINLYINVFEGKKYYIRNIQWVGNTIYPSELLSNMLGLKKGDVFDQKILDKRLQVDEDAVSSLYLDNGYLFFNVQPVEVAVENDSIDFEMRIYEGRKATINNVIILGNTKTNEHVVRRELRTLPGELFSKADIIRTVRELATLGHFEPEKIEPIPIPDQANGTVDIQYKLVERANDQLELSGGYGYSNFIGTVGIKFSNFSYRNFFKLKEWRPVPSGDGQSLSVRLQTNGTYYRTYSISFSDPWFGGKKPNSLSVSAAYSHVGDPSSYIYQTSDTYMNTISGSVALGRRLRWPDDWFTIQNEVGIQRYSLLNAGDRYSLPINTGTFNNLYFGTTISRNSLDQPIYPRTGSNYSLHIQFTPPFSLLNGKDYKSTSLSDEDRYKWIEYHKWTFKAETYQSIVGNLVFMTRANFGVLGRYNNDVGYSPFEKFNMGGSGMMMYNYTNEEIVSMRGYVDGSLTPYATKDGSKNGNLFDRFTAELRYPIALKESATVFGLVFAEAGNCWSDSKDFNPFDLKRSMGVGARVFLPMFGLLGIDFGYGFDKANLDSGQKWEFHFTMGQQF
jgi:outer membrane protein insertion porin family